MTTAPAAVRPRLALVGWAVPLLLLSLPAGLPLFIITVVGLPLVGVFGAGIPLAVAGVWLTRRLTDVHRWIFARVLDVPIPRPYRRPPAAGRLRRLAAPLGDPATWRDLGWLLLDSTIGFTVYLLVISLFGGFLWYASLPLLWWILAQSAGADTAALVLRTDFGLWAIDSQETSFVAIPIAIALLLLALWLTPPLMRGYARLSRSLLGPPGTTTLAARVQELTESRADTVDAQAAELRRIERDLHDGAQARLVSLGMSLGMAEEQLRTDPEAAARLLAEAQADSGQALAELRALVRGIHPPVLADRGLSGAVQALGIAHPLPVEVDDQLSGRLPAPVESAAYFAISELLTNVAKHAHARVVVVELGYGDGRLRMTVSDDGRGGAAETNGGGLQGVRRRLSSFDGTVDVSSPAGGPTVINMEIPCQPVTPSAR